MKCRAWSLPMEIYCEKDTVGLPVKCIFQIVQGVSGRQKKNGLILSETKLPVEICFSATSMADNEAKVHDRMH